MRTKSLANQAYLNTLLFLLSFYCCVHFSSSFDPQRRTSSTLSATIVNINDDKMMPSSSSSSSVRSFPNWRVVNVRNNEHDSLRRSPFSHVLSDDNNNDALAVASWSESAYRSSLDLYDRMMRMTDDEGEAHNNKDDGSQSEREGIASMTKRALDDVTSIYRLYGPQCTIGSYNGGKDAVVVLHLMRAAHANYCRTIMLDSNSSNSNSNGNNGNYPRPRVIYFQHNGEFPEVLSLLHYTVTKFDLDMLAFEEGVGYVDGLTYLVKNNIISTTSSSLSSSSSVTPHPLAFVLGTRKDDPNAAGQGVYAPSSSYMPPFMRCNPIIDWDYGKVWEFLRHTEWRMDVPYCSLYDMGYTSLGTVKDTLPCPALLKKKDCKNEEEEEEKEGNADYWPAYMLKDWSMERAGRIDKKQTNDLATEEVHSTQPLSLLSSQTEKHASSSTTSRRRLTVGLIVIGDEILKGMTPDSNIVAAAKALRSNGISLSRVSVVSDDPQDIVNEIQRFVKIDKDNNALVDIVITSGGVGPTHDDVTIKSVAQALNLGMEINHEMAELLLEKMGSNVVEEVCDNNVGGDRREALVRRLSEGQRKMSMLPTSSVLQYLGGKNNDDIQNNDTTSKQWPLLQCKNIFILPGVPLYFEKKIQQLAAYLPSLESTTASPLPRSETHRIVLALPEDTIVKALNAAVAAHPQVSFGSYPIVRTSSDEAPKTIITLEGKVQHESLFLTKADIDRNVEIAKEDLLSSLPKEGIVCVDAFDDLNIK